MHCRILVGFVLCLGILFNGSEAVWGQPLTPKSGLRSLAVEMEELYSERFGLSAQGVPTVTIGIMDGQRQVSFVPLKTMYAIYYQADGSPRTVLLRRGRRYRIQQVRGKEADVRYAIVAFSQRRAYWSQWASLVKQWKQRGYKVKTVTTGSIFAVKGQLFDNRRRLAIIGYEDRAFRARLKAARIASKYKRPVFVRTVLDTKPEGLFRLRGTGRQIFSKQLIEIRSTGGLVKVDRVEFGRGYSWHRFRRRTFRGSLLVSVDSDGRLVLMNRISLPDYLAGLLAAEMPLRAPLEALRAQSVTARNEILAKIGTRHQADPYLFCAHTHCQVYTGLHKDDVKIRRVLQSTRGEVMVTPKGYLADTPYSAMCGGHTEHNENVWADQPRATLRGRPDTKSVPASFQRGINDQNILSWLSNPPDSFCSASSRYARNKFRWSKYLRAGQANALVNRKFPVGAIRGIRVLKRGVSGRAYRVQIIGTQQTITVRGELKIRRLLGNLNSSMFVVEPVTDAQRNILGWRFTGGGWGHGVGMCQYGAMGRAKTGFTYRQILAHYYKGNRIVKLYP